MSISTSQLGPLLRQRWSIQGQVQGVGFRPFVYRLAVAHGLSGFVYNNGAGVELEIQGLAADLQHFAEALHREQPPLAVLDRVLVAPAPPHPDDEGFCIQASRDENPQARVTIDTALCDDCRRELLNPADRRHRHALINCTNCGPRYTLLHHVPYDRPNTTMASFRMCDACGGEYADPLNRRFHAQPIACPHCGPRLELVDTRGRKLAGDAITTAAAMLANGKILAIKGLGGFHLAVRADRDAAVARLRRRKHRDAKPLAIMVRNLEEAGQLVRLSPACEALMMSPCCPIVLAHRHDRGAVSEFVAPKSHRLGVMLPYTPIHHLLLACENPRLGPLVMTSANLSDEPLVIDNDEARERLGKLCDGFLWHDRPIARPVDDSIYLDSVQAKPVILRRARGEAPKAIALDERFEEPGLCVGGELKNTVCLVRHGRAILSQHLGDLKHPLAYANFRTTIDDLLRLFEVQPAWIAHDLHPAYLSTRYARQFAATQGIESIAIQHHHAHAASLLAEHHEPGPILAMVCDGVGYGDDGNSWGGELLLADRCAYQRLAHVRPLRLLGGDAAARDTRRCALALLYQAFGDDFAEHPSAAALYRQRDKRTMLCELIRRNISCAQSTAAGRVFDGIAALLGVCASNHYEAQAPMQLEAMASRHRGPQSWQQSLYRPGEGLIDPAPLTRALLEAQQAGRAVTELAALFHTAWAGAWVQAVLDAAMRTGIRKAGLTGGVFCNELLTRHVSEQLDAARVCVLRHANVPPNDGGIALGQAAIATARFMNKGV